MSNRAIPRAFLKNPMQNGMGRYICQLQRVTLNFCKSSPGSFGMRSFIEEHLLNFTQANPGVVVYVKPRRHRAPTLVAEYLNNRRESINTNNLDVGEVCRWLEHLRTRSGVQIVNVAKHWHTDTPSVQGPWHPFLHRDPALAATPLPDPDLYAARPQQLSATDMVQQEAGVRPLGSVDTASTKE